MQYKFSIVFLSVALLLSGCFAPIERSDAGGAAKWKTFTNKEYGFSFDYPATLNGNKLAILQQKNRFLLSGLNGAGQDFEVPFTIGLDIKSESDLDRFIKEKYGISCTFGGLSVEADESDLFIVTILENLEAEGCWVNWITILRYSPEKGKVVSIDLGQEPPIFETNQNGFVDYSQQVIDSFRFVE